MGHIVLLGDSIFDNGRYVPGGPAVIEHLRRGVPAGWRASLLAVDGAVAEEVAEQCAGVPADATHLAVSVGGNNALGHSYMILHEPSESYLQALTGLAEIIDEFREEYRAMLQSVLALGKPTIVCTVYDAIPGLGAAERLGLGLFNDVILREAFSARVGVLDLRHVCTEPSDYAPSSPIEPSVKGGGKIARVLARIVAKHDFAGPGTHVFTAAD